MQAISAACPESKIAVEHIGVGEPQIRTGGRHIHVGIEDVTVGNVPAAGSKHDGAADSLVDGEVVDRAAVVSEDVVDSESPGGVRQRSAECPAVQAESAAAEEALDGGALAQCHGVGGQVFGIVCRTGIGAGGN